MSKSLGNAIGIHEPPLEMYGKIMSISDEMMWKYYELLTDVQVPDIEKMKQEAHPMQAKKELARRIVADFHGPDAATQSADDWAKQFQKDEVPENVEEVSIRYEEIAWTGKDDQPEATLTAHALGVRLDRLLVKCGLADSATDASRKLKQGSVKVFDKVEHNPRIAIADLPFKMPLRVGKRLKIAVVTQ